MMLVYSIVLVFGTTHLVAGAGERDLDNPYCLQFTFLGPEPARDVNCSEHERTPCVAPFVYTPDGTPPNVTYMWANLNQSEISCPMDSAHTCMKYTWIYNKAVLNVSYFCGKMIEDKTTAILSGCFSQQVNGHTVEVCACQSEAGRIPCNSSNKARRSIKMLVILTLVATFLCNILLANNRLLV